MLIKEIPHYIVTAEPFQSQVANLSNFLISQTFQWVRCEIIEMFLDCIGSERNLHNACVAHGHTLADSRSNVKRLEGRFPVSGAYFQFAFILCRIIAPCKPITHEWNSCMTIPIK